MRLGTLTWTSSSASPRLYQLLINGEPVPVFIAIVLFVAAFSKAHHAATADLADNGMLSSRSVVVLVVLFELGTGFWLASGRYRRAARQVVMLTFLGFLQMALYLELTNAKTCSCLGRISVAPWQAIILDLVCIMLLWLWKPLCSHAGTGLGALSGFIIPWMVTSGIFSVAVWDYAPAGPLHSLRNDSRLRRPVVISGTNVKPVTVLDELARSTGLSYTVTDSLSGPSGLLDLGTIQTDRAFAWALMEWLVASWTSPCRWEGNSSGYTLVPAARLGKVAPWMIGGFVVLGLLLKWVIGNASTTDQGLARTSCIENTPSLSR
jgi:hypothetical protein